MFDLDQARYLGDARSRGYTLDHVVQAGHARVSVLLCGSRDLRDREQASIWPSLPSHNDSGRYVDIGRSVAGGLRIFCASLNTCVGHGGTRSVTA